jgi:hypothetical protein
MSGHGKSLRVVCTVLAGLGIALEAGAQPVVGQGKTGFTCCNFHVAGDWISDANWFIHPKIPAGSPVRILEYGEFRVAIEVAGRPLFLGLDYGRKMHVRDWASRMVLAENPEDRIAEWPDSVREAIREGRIELGMSKEQVVVSVGYPPAHATPSMDLAQWKYWYDTHGTYLVVWNDAGFVKDVLATPQIRSAVLRDGGAVPAAGAQPSAPVGLKDLEGLMPQAGGAGK